MKLTPMLFSTPMVQALQAGTKLQTRRIVKLRDGSLPEEDDMSYHQDGTVDHVMDFSKTFPYWQDLPCKYGKAGDVIWVRETWFQGYPYENDIPQYDKLEYWYRADSGDARPGDVSDEWCINEFGAENRNMWPKWKPSLFMPKDACRIFLKITDIRIERLQDISESDAIVEGCSFSEPYYQFGRDYGATTHKQLYKILWESINGKGSWESNPFVWVIQFERIENPETV